MEGEELSAKIAKDLIKKEQEKVKQNIEVAKETSEAMDRGKIDVRPAFRLHYEDLQNAEEALGEMESSEYVCYDDKTQEKVKKMNEKYEYILKRIEVKNVDISKSVGNKFLALGITKKIFEAQIKHLNKRKKKYEDKMRKIVSRDLKQQLVSKVQNYEINMDALDDELNDEYEARKQNFIESKGIKSSVKSGTLVLQSLWKMGTLYPYVGILNMKNGVIQRLNETNFLHKFIISPSRTTKFLGVEFEGKDHKSK